MAPFRYRFTTALAAYSLVAGFMMKSSSLQAAGGQDERHFYRQRLVESLVLLMPGWSPLLRVLYDALHAPRDAGPAGQDGPHFSQIRGAFENGVRLGQATLPEEGPGGVREQVDQIMAEQFLDALSPEAYVQLAWNLGLPLALDSSDFQEDEEATKVPEATKVELLETPPTETGENAIPMADAQIRESQLLQDYGRWDRLLQIANGRIQLKKFRPLRCWLGDKRLKTLLLKSKDVVFAVQPALEVKTPSTSSSSRPTVSEDLYKRVESLPPNSFLPAVTTLSALSSARTQELLHGRIMPQGPIRVLIVDEDASTRVLVALILRRLSNELGVINIFEAGDIQEAAEALKNAKDSKFHFAIFGSDRQAKTNSIAKWRLFEKDHGVKAIPMIAYGRKRSEGEIAGFYNSGANLFLTKGVALKQDFHEAIIELISEESSKEDEYFEISTDDFQCVRRPASSSSSLSKDARL